MAGSPTWKVYSGDGEYIAAVKYLEDAAALVAMRGDGTTIRYQHGVVIWREGKETQPAGESYDYVAETCRTRVHAKHVASYERTHGAGGARKIIP